MLDTGKAVGELTVDSASLPPSFTGEYAKEEVDERIRGFPRRADIKLLVGVLRTASNNRLFLKLPIMVAPFLSPSQLVVYGA